MFDLHQGNTFEERGDDQPPTAIELAMAELDALNALGKGRPRSFAMQQLRVLGLLGALARDAVKSRLARR